jgi:PAS domain-containing protein
MLAQDIDFHDIF